MSACPEASALLNPTCCVVSGVPVTDSSWGYFLPLSTVWAFLTDGGWLEWLEHFEWQWLTARWHGATGGGERGWQVSDSFPSRWTQETQCWEVAGETSVSSPAAMAVNHLRGPTSLKTADLLCLCPGKRMFVSWSLFWYGNTGTISSKKCSEDGSWPRRDSINFGSR